jgi:hypothetical protein
MVQNEKYRKLPTEDIQVDADFVHVDGDNDIIATHVPSAAMVVEIDPPSHVPEGGYGATEGLQQQPQQQFNSIQVPLPTELSEEEYEKKRKVAAGVAAGCLGWYVMM